MKAQNAHSKVYFCEMYPTGVSSKLCEFICSVQNMNPHIRQSAESAEQNLLLAKREKKSNLNEALTMTKMFNFL